MWAFFWVRQSGHPECEYHFVILGTVGGSDELRVGYEAEW